MIAAVITADGMWAGAAGIDGPKGRKAEATDEFGIASVSKVLLAALILKLADQGKVDLDAPLADYLDGLDVDANGATLRQALAMRSGMAPRRTARSSRPLPSAIGPGRPPTSSARFPIPSRQRAAGTSTRTHLQARLVAAENASGKKLDDALKSLVIDPADSGRILLQGRTPHPRSPGRCLSKGTAAGSTSRNSGSAATFRASGSRRSPGELAASPAMHPHSPGGGGTCSPVTSSRRTAWGR